MNERTNTPEFGNGSRWESILRVEIQKKFYVDEQILGEIEFSLGAGESRQLLVHQASVNQRCCA